MKKVLFSGAATALITPFREDGSLDIAGLEQLIEFQIENGIRAIILAGTTGEGSTLTFEEFKTLITKGVQFTHGRVPIIAGTGSNDTEKSVRLSKEAEQCGADGLLIVTPYYNKTSQEGLLQHYTKIANHVQIPIILYNVPPRTGMGIHPETAKKLMHLPNIIGIKEASGNISSVADIAVACPELPIYSGNDDQILPILSLGGRGVISVLSNIAPQEVQRICTLYEQGKAEKATQLQLKLLPLIRTLFADINPMPIKCAMNIQYLPCGNPRLPLIPCNDQMKERIRLSIKEAGI